MLYYQRHIFFCTNYRDNDTCCENHGAAQMHKYAKQRTKELRLAGAGKVRVNSAGCLGRCQEGPVLVIYPEGIWYTYQNQEDVDEIIEEHLLQGRIVQRLRLS